MPKKKPKHQEPPKHPPSLEEMGTKDLLRSIRADLDEKAKHAGLAHPESPLKPPRAR